MNFRSALYKANLDRSLWIRPKSLKGLKIAFCVREDGFICRVPTHKGAEPSHFLQVEEMLGLWEVVTPEKVNRGK